MFLKISIDSLNLFSFVMGMLYAVASSYGWYSKRNVWLTIVAYFALVAVYFYYVSIGVLS